MIAYLAVEKIQNRMIVSKMRKKMQPFNKLSIDNLKIKHYLFNKIF